jgi:hypothetical protein
MRLTPPSYTLRVHVRVPPNCEKVKPALSTTAMNVIPGGNTFSTMTPVIEILEVSVIVIDTVSPGRGFKGSAQSVTMTLVGKGVKVRVGVAVFVLVGR